MTPGPDDITLGELGRRLNSLEARAETRFTAMESRLDDRFSEIGRQMERLQFVSRDYYDVAHKSLVERVEKLEDAAVKGRLLLLGSFVYPILGGLILLWVNR